LLKEISHLESAVVKGEGMEVKMMKQLEPRLRELELSRMT